MFPLTQTVASLGSTSVADNGSSQPATLTFLGIKTSSGISTTPGITGTPVFLLSVAGLNLGSDAQVATDNTKVSLSSGGSLSLAGGALNYTQFGLWLYQPTTSSAYLGTLVTGYQTPTGNVPTTGTGTYVGNGSGTGGTFGTVFIPDGAGSISQASLSGQANISVNFATAAVNGSLTNMTATTMSNSAQTPWNNVSLSGTLSGSSINGNTSTTGAPAGGSYGLSAAATGKFAGALYGPNGEELGATWTLSEPSATNGKTAFGTLAATKQ